MAEEPGATLRRVLLAKCGDYSLVRVDGTLVLEEGSTRRLTEDDGDDFYHHIGVYFGAEVEMVVAVGVSDGPVGTDEEG